ncbi:acetate--CoA ligase family protein [Salinarimonas sp.]|uniref:acetate--CoA ligase family protein n=1 Tax=Salinarimonas sp. TaxID=2766526 RepID=UPI00391AAC7F
MTSDTAPARAGLASLVAPRSVAILGASDDPTRIGGRPIAYLREGGFRGAIYPVNPKRERVQGLPAFARLADLPEAPEAAIVALPAPLVEEAVAALGAAGTRACTIFSSGFAEIGEEALQRRISESARAHGMRLLGPNCLGLFDVRSGFYGTFSTTLDRGTPQPGSLSIVSQSGAFGSHLYYLARRRGLGMRTWISTGNEADIDVAECLEHLAQDEGTRVIMAYAEGFRDGEALVRALETARRNAKPVIFMKVGRSEVGADAASSHTAALAGADEVVDAVLRQYGAYRARTASELVDIACAASASALPSGRRIGLVTISGGVGVLMADEASDRGLDVAPMPEPVQRALKEQLPYAGVRNPIDVTAQAFNDPSLLARNIETVVAQGGYDAVVAFFTSIPGSAANAGPVRDALEGVRKAYPDFPLLLSMLVPEPMRRDYEAMGYPVFEDPSAAVGAVAAMAHFAEAFSRPHLSFPSPPAKLSKAAIPGREAGSPSASGVTIHGEKGPLDEAQAKSILARAGIPVPDERLARDAEEAVAAWRALGRPVALKLASPDIAHKTEVGGVVLGLDAQADIREAFAAILARARAAAPQARLSGVLVAPMETGGVETILGVTRDPVFGPVVLLGTGGVLVEVVRDVSFRRAPVDEEEALRMIDELRCRAILDGVRGAPPADKSALARAVAALSRLAVAQAETIESIDVNPFLVRSEGAGAVALDALVVPRARDD